MEAATRYGITEDWLAGQAREGWRAGRAERQHPLASLDGRPLGPMRVHVLLGPESRRSGARYFRVYLLHRERGLSLRPVLVGAHRSGPLPTHNWIEVMECDIHPDFPAGEGQASLSVDIERRGLLRRLYAYLCSLIPAGGHIMVEYETGMHRDTRAALQAGVPPVATPLGFMLYDVGCGAGFKDWYFPEGGSEGPRKLQGEKPLDAGHARLLAERMGRDLLSFLACDASGSRVLSDAGLRAFEALALMPLRFQV